MEILEAAQVRYLVGGAYAFAQFTGIHRHTKDFDVFLLPGDISRAMDAFRQAGWYSEVTFEHWLAKAYRGEYFVDLIYGLGNGVSQVDEGWFDHAPRGSVLGRQVQMCAPEEMFWSKAYIQERERFDGADCLHLLRARADTMDWQRLLDRFGDHWPVLLSHLLMFSFVYPGDRHRIPSHVLRGLLDRARQQDGHWRDARVCNGTLLSRQQYLTDLETWGYEDARRLPSNHMSEEDIARWTAGIAVDGST